MAIQLDDRQVLNRAALGMVGSSAGDSLDTILPKIDAETAKLFEDRNATLAEGGTITWDGSTIGFSSNLKLHMNSNTTGAAPVLVDLGSASRTLSADGRMVYAVINRSAGTAVITDDSATLPAVTSANQEVFVIAKRVGTRLYFRNGFVMNSGDSTLLGQPLSSVTPSFSDADFTIQDNVDNTKQLKFEVAGLTTSTTRTITMPDANVDLGNLTNSNISSSAGIVYSKLSLTNSILNADIATGAAIAVNKLAALTADRAVITDVSGFLSPATVTSTELGYVSGVTSALQTQLDSKLNLSGSNGPMTGTLDMGANKITTTYVPTNGPDLVNKTYADALTPGSVTNLQSLFTAGFRSFVDESSQLTPVTGTPSTGEFKTFGIVNRRTIPDLANDIRMRMGTYDRIEFQSLMELQDEIGPNGEKVYKLPNDDRNIIRFVGTWTAQNNTNGQYVNAASDGDFIEIVFYGSGLNLLMVNNASGYQITSTVDGGAEGTNFVPASISSILSGRKYSQNQIVPVTGISTTGLHSVKLKRSSAGMLISGIEIIHNTTTLNIRPGTMYQYGKKLTLGSEQTLAYNSSFDTITQDGSSTTLGTKGAYVVVYEKADATIGKAAYIPSTTPSYLGSTPPVYETPIKTCHWREFGSWRLEYDDFSTLGYSGGSSRAGTLEDGLTTLVALTVGTASQVTVADALQLQSTNAFVTITFFGTGLGLYSYGDGVGSPDATEFFVDGVSKGTLATANTLNKLNYTKIASGLQLGTHIVKINRNAAAGGSAFNIERFVIYGPLKPTVPAGASEIGSYYLLGDFSANSTGTINNISQGVIRKQCTREIVYAGSWGITGVDPTGTASGYLPNTNASGATYRVPFYGVGFELRGRGQTATSTNVTMSIRKTAGGSASTINTTNFSINHNGGGASGSAVFQANTINTTAYGGFSFTPASGAISFAVSNTNGSGVSVSNLDLGWYEIVFTNNEANYFNLDNIDIITPVYAPKQNYPLDVQNSLPVGSCSVADLRGTSPVKSEDRKKAIVKVYGVASSPTTSSGSQVVMPDMAATIKVNNEAGANLKLSLTAGALNSAGTNSGQFQFYVDQKAVDTEYQVNFPTSGLPMIISMSTIIPVGPGTHNVQVFWRTGGGTLTAQSANRVLVVEEL